MEAVIGRIFHKYGTMVDILHDGRWQKVQVFFQPIISRNLYNMRREVSALGEIPGGQYVILGKAGQIAEGDTLRLREENYGIRRLDTLYFGLEPVYCWGLCSKKGAQDRWGI